MSETNDVIAIQMEQLYQYYSINNILGQMYDNLVLISEGAAGQIINVSNVSLYFLAAKYYGDPMEWTVIAAANGLKDPMVIAPTGQSIQLTIPASAVSTGGILSQ